MRPIYCDGAEAKPWSRSHEISEAEMTDEAESDELRLEAVAKSRPDSLARYG